MRSPLPALRSKPPAPRPPLQAPRPPPSALCPWPPAPRSPLQAPRSPLQAPRSPLLAPSSKPSTIHHHPSTIREASPSAIHKLRLATAGRLPGFAKAAFLKLRELDAASRALPDFLVIGAQKAGSTSLFNTLCTHPRIIGSVPKEIFFFNSHFTRGERWYRRHFPRRSTLARRNARCGEGSTTYLTHPAAPARAAKLVPQAKLIALLREPAARTVSHYHHRVRAGAERRPIDVVFSPATIRQWIAGQTLSSADALYFEYSFYAAGLRNWMRHFSRDQLLILESEQLFSDPQKQLDAVCAHLDLDVMHLESMRADKSAGSGAVKPQAFCALQAAFATANRQLHDFGFQPSWAQ